MVERNKEDIGKEESELRFDFPLNSNGDFVSGTWSLGLNDKCYRGYEIDIAVIAMKDEELERGHDSSWNSGFVMISQCSDEIPRPVSIHTRVPHIGRTDYREFTNRFTFNNQLDVLIIQIYSVIKLYMFRASSLPIVRSSLLYIRHW